MNDDLTLVIMAAGMGSRFGGLKQIEPVGPNGEFIIDYSIYDAIKVGFKRVIFIIKEENYDIFRETIGKRIENKIKVEYAFQKPEFEFNGITYKREKPWGTAHAISSVRNMIHGNFLVINSDDFYGRDAYKTAISFFKNNRNINKFAMVSYNVINTITENGSVKRGICKISDNMLKDIVESKIESKNGKLIASPLNGDSSFEIEPNEKVSMNVLLFTPYIFKLIGDYFEDFVNNVNENFDGSEYLIPDVLKKALEDNKITVEVLTTTAKWEGVTYKEDKASVVSAIEKLIENGEYPRYLWKD